VRTLNEQNPEEYHRTRDGEVTAAVVMAAGQFLDPERVALLAVGGYGRGDLFPYSDIDLLILVDQPETAQDVKESIGSLLRVLWDSSLCPSHSVHTVEECCQLDATNPELTISLLTQRRLWGSERLYGALSAKLPAFLRAQRKNLTGHLLRLTEQRHVRFADTIYHLEPDIKEAPGGLRDLHFAEWLEKLGSGGPGPAAEGLPEARRFLARLRLGLHLRAGRNDNRLTFDAQDDLFADPSGAMRDYYRHARLVARQCQLAMRSAEQPSSGMIRSFLDWRSRLSNAEFTVSEDQVLLRSPHALSGDPPLAMRLMQFVARHGVSLAPDTERRLEEAASRAEFRVPEISLWRDLSELLNLPHAARALRVMHQSGLLRRILPEWTRIECLVTRDFYHRYTVDEHTLVTLESLEYLATSKDDPRAAMRGLLSECPDQHLLRLSLILHDIGKGGGTGNHELESTRLTAEILGRLGVSAQERETVLFLVENHIVLSSIISGRDLHDAETVRGAAHQIGTIERLQMLTLLTYADISAVNPTAMTPWRLTQLWSAYRSLYAELTRELDAERIAPAAAADPGQAAFLDGFPTRYLKVHSAEEVDRHFRLSLKLGDKPVAVNLEAGEGSWDLTVVTRDRPHLFADLAGTLASFGMNILRAEAFGNREGLVLDILVFEDPLRRLELNPDEVGDLRRLVERVVLGQEDVEKRLAGRRLKRSGKPRGVRPHVGFNDEASARSTLLEVVAEDRPGLLHDLAHSISRAGCSIEVVLVNTEASRAIDVFYLTHGGAKVPAAIQEQLVADLRQVISA
jgi:[protein-PII] uridylyltransferase